MKESTVRGLWSFLEDKRQNCPKTIRDKISQLRRVEDTYGDLDEKSIQEIDELTKKLRCKPSGEPCHQIPFPYGGKPETGTAHIKVAVVAYQEFRSKR